DLEMLRVRSPDLSRLSQLFTELEFRSLIPKLEQFGALEAGGAGGPAPEAERAPAVARSPAPPREFAEPEIVDDPAALGAVVAECRRAPLLALNTETTSLDAMRGELVGLSLAVAPGRSWYLPFGHVAAVGELAGGAPPPNLPPLPSDALRARRELLLYRQRDGAAVARSVSARARRPPPAPPARGDRGAAHSSAREHGVARSADRPGAARGDLTAVGGRARGARAGDPPRRGDRLQHQLDPTAAAHPVREAPATRREEDEDRRVHRRRGPRAACRDGARSAEAAHRI